MSPRARAARRAAALLTATLLALPLVPSGAAGADLTVAVSTASGAVRDGQAVTVSGSAPDGGVVTAATVIAVQGDGSEVRQPIGEASLNGADTRATYVRVDGDDLRGRFVASCLFAPPVNPCPLGERSDVRSLVLEVTVSGQTARSNPLRVDYTDPLLRRYDVTAPNSIRVLFTEPVVAPDGDSPADFTVSYAGRDRVVTRMTDPAGPDCPAGSDPWAVGQQGCSRVLELLEALPEDAEPTVTYVPAANRRGYVDLVGNTLDRSRGALEDTQDLVRPVVPRVDTVDGKAPSGDRSTVTSGATAPVVRVSNVTPGHSVRVEVVSPNGNRSSVGPVTATDDASPVSSDGTATLTLPAQTEQGTYVLTVVTTDLNGNQSTESTKTAPRADGSPNPVEYVLDSVAPRLVSATSVDGTSVVVLLSEPVTPQGSPGDFRITNPDRPVTAVSGSGAQRTLSSAGVPRGALLRYAPTSAESRYRDAAGNLVADQEVLVGGVALPVVTSPAAPVFTPATTFVVRGTADAGSLVEVFRDGGNDGTPDGPAVASQQLAAGAQEFGVTVPLASGANDLVVVASNAQGRSPVADVPTITQDSAAPALALTSPTAGQAVPGKSTQQVTYTHSDAHPGTVTTELSVDDGRTFTPIEVGGAPDGSVSYQTREVSTTTARVRLTAVDRAGNTTTLLSERFEIDAVRPSFGARTLSPREVLVTFNEPVRGTVSNLDFSVRGQPASAARADGDRSGSDVDGVNQIVLTTSPLVTLGPGEEPEVRYAPRPGSTRLRDRAGQTVDQTAATAVDGIAPERPTVTDPATTKVVAATTVPVSGRGEPGTTVTVVDASGAAASSPVTVAPDGTWRADAQLAPDTVNRLRVGARDARGNVSRGETDVPALEQDSQNPVVRVLEPAPRQVVAPGSAVTIRWESEDAHLLEGQTRVEVSTDGGLTWQLLQEGAPSDGSTLWRAPQTTTSGGRVRVSTPDSAGRVGVAVSGFGVGTEPDAGPSPSSSTGTSPAPGASSAPSGSASPSASSTASPGPGGSGGPSASASASPSASAGPSSSATPVPGGSSPGRLTTSVSPGTITPGVRSQVLVQGPAGSPVELWAYSRPSTRYTVVRRGTLGTDGAVRFAVTPGTNTRLFAAVPGQPDSGSASVVINVRTALSLTVVRNGSRDYTFQGRILPRRAGQLITLYRVDRGREIITKQIRTDSTGTYRIRRVFTGSGTFGFLTRTGQTLTNAAGVSNGGRARPTAIYPGPQR